VFAVLWPLGRRGAVREGSEFAVYRDQLDEIARDKASGLIGDAEAEAAKVEVSRRLIAAADTAEAERADGGGSPLLRRRVAAVTGFALLPIGAVALYLALGSPQLPGQPLAARMQSGPQNQSMAGLIAQVEQHLEKNPQDARGWELLGPIYLRLGRFEDAVAARRRSLALSGENAERQSDLGEALVAAANGIVTAEARTAFERAVALDAQDMKARFYLGMAAEQDGNKERAAAIWRAMLENAPADASWAPMVRDALARASGAGPSGDDIAAASNMNPQERATMIRGMVDRLAERLKKDGGDVDGWLRLVRAYVVLGERDKANAAAGDAKRALAREPEKVKRIDEMAKNLGLPG
jgi:cytochrome c-type biogenesis protein CcmH